MDNLQLLGLLLLICSSDGYVTIARFSEGAFGEKLSEEATPLQVKKTYPLIYNCCNEAPSISITGNI